MLRLVNDRRGRREEAWARQPGGVVEAERFDSTYSEAVVVQEAEVVAGGQEEGGGWTMDWFGGDKGLQRHGGSGCGPGGKD